MNKSYHNFIGIDIGKSEFVSFANTHTKTFEYTNNKAGFRGFFKEYKDVLKNTLVVLETTGGYESELLHFLLSKEIIVHRANTRKVKNFIRSYGKHAKTDKLDAMALSKYGFERHASLEPYKKHSEKQEELKLLVERRQDLTKMLVQEKNRYKAPLSKPLHKSILKVIACLEKEIEKINVTTENLIEQDKEMEGKKAILLDIPGVGPATANALLALLPELGQLDRKQIASLCGLAPHPRQSGTKVWRGKTVGGRRNMRPILFLAAMGACRSKSSNLSKTYEKLVKKGKKPIVALVALMRKIVVIANARIKEVFYSNLLIEKNLKS